MLLSLLSFFAVVAQASSSSSGDSLACSCGSGFIPVPVDVTIPVDPSNSEGLNSTNTFRLQTTFKVYGELCEPVASDSKYKGTFIRLVVYSHLTWVRRCRTVALTRPDIHLAVLGRNLGRIAKLLLRHALVPPGHFFLCLRQYRRGPDNAA